MKTSSNNNNIESNNQEFFTKGTKYRCIKSVKGDFTKGKVYDQSSDPTQWYGYFRNDKGIHHVWPQPAQIDHSCELYDMKPEDVDPRLYFEPVEDTREAEGIKVGTEVWTTIELHEEYGKRGHVVRKYFADHGVWCLDIEFEDGTTACYAEEYVTTEKPWAVVGAKCRHRYLDRDVVLTITAVGQYYGIKAESEDGKVKRCGLVRDFEPVEDIREAEGIKVGDKVRHNKHEEVATVTAIREAFVNGCDGYRYLYTLDFGQSVKGPFDVELNGGEFLRESFTLQEAQEIKPKAAFQIGDRVERKSDGERGTVDGYDVTDGKLTYIVKYDRTQCRQSDGFEYQSEELYGDELQAVRYLEQSELESLTVKYAKQIEESALLGCGCMVGDGDESRKDSKCVKVRTAYKNDSHDAKDWTYCVSWYETTPIKGDADGQHQTLRECENGILLEQAARHMAYFELMASKGWTLDEILYGKAA